MSENLAEMLDISELAFESPLRDRCDSSVTTVFLLPGLGGDERELAALREGCLPTVHCVPVQLPDWTELYTRAMTLDQLVEYCRAQIESLAPTGSLRLAGYSFGGTMAYKLATVLTAAGRHIDRLGLLDTAATPVVATTSPSLKGRWRRFATAVREREVTREICGTFAGLVMRSGNSRILLALGHLRRYRLPFKIQDHLNKPITCRLREKLLLDLVERMRAPESRLDVSAVLFRSTQQHVVDATPDLGWSRYFSYLEIINLPGDHHNVIKPENVAALCAAFTQAMADPASTR